MADYRKRLLAVLLLGLGALTLGACNTLAGVGEDISSAGQGLSGEADKQNPDKL